MTELICKSCGQEVSGPDEKDVRATMDRHIKDKHPQKKQVKK